MVWAHKGFCFFVFAILHVTWCFWGLPSPSERRIDLVQILTYALRKFIHFFQGFCQLQEVYVFIASFASNFTSFPNSRSYSNSYSCVSFNWPRHGWNSAFFFNLQTHAHPMCANKEGCIKGLGRKRSGFFTRKNNIELLYWTLDLPVLIFLPREQAACSHLFPLSSPRYILFPSPKSYGRINYHVFTKSQVPAVKSSSFAPKFFPKTKTRGNLEITMKTIFLHHQYKQEAQKLSVTSWD